ncbi:MAG: transcriptional regulator NrdR [Planctomycetota bacterium]
MRCPFCSAVEDRVIDSRSSTDGDVIRRRRECQACERRFTTYERVEEMPRLVLKKDLTREVFSRQKVLQGLLKACEKRPVSVARLEEVVDLVERRLDEQQSSEVESRFIGEILADQLRQIDQVAYVRFASVYREFADVSEFLHELAPLVEARESPPGVAPPGGAAPNDD